MAEMRLQKFLARAGVASRRHAEELIAAGRVTVNGARVTEMGVKVDPAADMVAVDGAPVALPEENATFLLHKPAGYVTTMSDPQGRPTVAALMADELLAHPGLFPVGRLDTDTTGLLLFTDDGQLGHGLSHPRRHVEKTYLALVEGVPDAGDVRRLREGVLLDDGPTLPAGVRVLEGADGLPGRAAYRRGGRSQRLPPAPRGQARPRRAGRQGILRGSAPARGPQPPSAPHAGSRGASGDRPAPRGLRARFVLGDLPRGASRPLAEEEVARLKELAS